MRKSYLAILFFIGTMLFIHAHSTPSSNAFSIQLSPGDTIFRIIPSESNTYGYDILVKNKILIHQQNIPGMPGNKGFPVKADAEKVARLVIKKIQRGMMPPTMERKELDSLKIKY